MSTDKDAHMDPFQACEANGFVANTDVALDAVRALGRLAAASDQVTGRVAGTYLKVLVATAQNWLADSRSPVEVVRVVHRSLYSHVLAGATTPDVAPDASDDPAERRRKTLERNRRTNFARTAASTLIAWMNSGGGLAVLLPANVTKSSLAEGTRGLIAYTARTTSGVPEIDAQRAVNRTYTRFLAAMKQLQASHPALATEAAETFVTAVKREFLSA